MARAAATSIENNFSKGLVTEATGLNFPENACQDTYDCVFKTTGVVTRREGFNPESGAVFQDIDDDTTAVSEYVWKDAANIGDLDIVVQQVGVTLYFFRVLSSGSLSDGKLSTEIDLTDHAVSGAPFATADGEVCQYASGNGRLFVTHRYCDPFYLEYSASTDSVSATDISIKIRDFKKLDDSLDIDERPTTLTPEHQYNLYNQGWYLSASTTSGTQNVMTYFYNKKSKYPSNSDVWWLFKNSSEELDSGQVDKVNRGNSPAPNGHYIVDAFYIDRTGVSGVGSLEVEDSVYERPSSVAFYSSRVFFGGVAADGFGDHIYFSPVLVDIADVGKCYQQQDPTSEDDSDLLPSDGGVIVIPGMGKLIKLVTLNSSVLAFTTVGVWQISGSTGSGFAANDYAVRKISTNFATGPMSFVEAEGRIFYWNINGIYILEPSQITDQFQVQSISDDSIKTFYETVPSDNIRYVKGAYNPKDMLIQWLYRSTSSNDYSEAFQYDRVLNFRLRTTAFYPWTVSTADDIAGAPSISGIVVTAGFGTSTSYETVVDNSSSTVVIEL